MQHWAPHPKAVFEGYYAKFTLPSGACVALIVCTVPDAPRRPHMVSFTYVPHDSTEIFQRELWVETVERVSTNLNNAFELRIPEIGHVKVHFDLTAEYQIDHKDFSFHARTTSNMPWSASRNTPEGLMIYLPLPLHWHVHSLASDCTFSLKIEGTPSTTLLQASGMAVVHEEKNWAKSFPKAHIWVQAREQDCGFCCAGGEILGMQAFLVGYRHKSHQIDFTLPFALRVFGFAPFMAVDVDWETRSFSLSVQSLWHKIVVKAKAPTGSFFSLSSPFPQGHRENFLAQSFQATLEVEVFERRWMGGWRLVRTDRFKNAALEFGGEYYPPAGTDMRTH